MAMAYLIKEIRRTFTNGNNIRTALEDLEEYDLIEKEPRLIISEDDTNDGIKVDEAKMKYRGEIDAFIIRKNTYEQKKTKTWVFCMETMYICIYWKKIQLMVSKWIWLNLTHSSKERTLMKKISKGICICMETMCISNANKDWTKKRFSCKN